MKIIKRTWSLVDKCDNPAEDQTQTITILDTIKPTFDVPADTVICRLVADEMLLNPDVEVTGSPANVADNCTDNATLLEGTTYTDDEPTGTDDEIRYITRHWTVTDACGNDSVMTQTIGVFPAIHAGNTTLEAPADTTIVLPYGQCDTLVELGEATLTTSVTGAGTINITNDKPAGVPYTVGTYTIVWTATDTCGFTVTDTQTVIVEFPPCDSVDFDGYTYPAVRIGCHCWLAENLRNTHYADGADVATVKDYNDDASNTETYGKLYSWYSAVRVAEGNDARAARSQP